MKSIPYRLSRRGFLSGIAGLGAAGLGTPWLRSDGSEPSASSSAWLKRKLGRTGIEIPIVNMGVMNASLSELVQRAYEKGVRYFDTAALYQRGRNELMIGQTLRDMGVRDDVLIGTKIYVPEPQRPKFSQEEWKKAFIEGTEGSLKRLRTDRLDILYFHSASDPGELTLPGVRAALEELKRQGKIRWTGFSSHRNMAAVVAAADGFFDVGEVAFNYAMADDASYLRTLARAAESGLGIVAMKTQCTQYWYRDFVPDNKQTLYQGRILHTAVLKWAVSHSFVSTAVPGFTTVDQLAEDLSVNAGLDFTPEEARFLEDKGVRRRMESTCVQCGSCVATCPREIDAPTLMRAHLYLAAYGNLDAARNALDELPASLGLNACDGCESCSIACARRVPLASRLGELRSLLG